MAESVRLSEASRQACEALAHFDQSTLEQLLTRLEGAAKGDIQIEAEPTANIEDSQKILASILMATEQNIAVLHRLRERKEGNPWAL